MDASENCGAAVGTLIRKYDNNKGGAMKNIRMAINESLLSEVDQAIRELKISRSVFIRSALMLALRNHTILKSEQQHAEGYARHPVLAGEFDVWENEQAWEEA